MSEEEIHKEYKQTESPEPGKDNDKSDTPNNSSESEEDVSGDSKQSKVQAKNNTEEPATDNSSSDTENNRDKNDNHEMPKGRINYMDMVASGAEAELSGKMGIDNKRLCRIKRVIPSRKPQDVEEPEPYSIYTPIANFCLVPMTIERNNYADNVSKASVHITVFSPEFPFGYQVLLLDTEDIEKVAKIVRQKFPQLYYDPDLTALEIKMGMARDEVFLVDDFRPSSLNSELMKMRGNLEKLIRFYGDGIGKGRGSIELKLREEFKPHSMCAVTGEYIHGTESSLQRLLIVSVDKNTYERELLKFYQDNPWIFRTHINLFITYLSQNAQK